jgi:phosphohistidine phosphatase
MTRTLYLLRHAKSSWELAGELDWERGLLPRGVDDAKAIAEYMSSAGIEPEYVICSSARRAKQTLAAVREVLPEHVEVLIADEAYQATPVDLFELVGSVSPDFESVLLVGHNPSIHDFAVDLAATGDELPQMAGKFPTATLAELEIECEWSELATDCATLAEFTRPKALR